MPKYKVRMREIDGNNPLDLKDVTPEQLVSISDFMSNSNTTFVETNNLILSKIGGRLYIMAWREVEQEE